MGSLDEVGALGGCPGDCSSPAILQAP
jgi:hypothetical protein